MGDRPHIFPGEDPPEVPAGLLPYRTPSWVPGATVAASAVVALAMVAVPIVGLAAVSTDWGCADSGRPDTCDASAQAGATLAVGIGVIAVGGVVALVLGMWCARDDEAKGKGAFAILLGLLSLPALGVALSQIA